MAQFPIGVIPPGVLGPATVNQNLAAQGMRMRGALGPRPETPIPQWMLQGLPMEGRATFLPFQDAAPGSVMNQRSLALPGILAGAVNAFTAPGRAYSGSDPSFDPQYEAANLAMNMMGGGVGVSAVVPQPRGTLGMFIGPSAKTWDAAAAQKAAEMVKAGVDERTIWKETGNWRGPDGRWRQEIPDNTASFIKDGFVNLPGGISASKVGNLSGILRHDNLYSAYPLTKQIDPAIEVGGPKLGASGSLSDDLIRVNAPNMDDAMSISLHEIQHAIQEKEKFARGGNSKNEFASARDMVNSLSAERDLLYGAIKYWQRVDSGMSKKDAMNGLTKEERIEALGFENSAQAVERAKVIENEISNAVNAAIDPYSSYFKLAGEAEARATQSRRHMTPEQRRAVFPADSYDVPINNLIIR